MAAEHDVTAHNDARLVTMANQIATFFASQPAVEPWRAVAAHLNDFWPPNMRARLLEMIAAGGADLRPAVVEAEPLIRRPGAPRVQELAVDPGTPPTRETVEGKPTNSAFAKVPEGSDG
ncbi:formate dehydrogenase [Paracoccus suum]|uniref:Formate dehydrogenase n=1 Tax=Paracoccus suum TaxID=2259340 RepID=A0A344PLB2_9RHOB|nr:formate dehydrogenase [Paracoccus suum]